LPFQKTSSNTGINYKRKEPAICKTMLIKETDISVFLINIVNQLAVYYGATMRCCKIMLISMLRRDMKVIVTG